MKKLMFAVAAIAAGAAMADVTSANVVGYQNKAIAQEMNNWFANTFVPCGKGKDAVTLGDLKPTSGFVSSSLSFLAPEGPVMTIDDPEYGEIDATYVYEGNPAWTIAGVAGWYTQADFDMGCNFPMNDVIIPLGQGVTVFAPGDEIGEGVTFNGEVYNGAVPLEITAEMNNWFGNCTPTKITLGDITVSSGFISSSLSFLAPEGPVKTIDDPEYGEIDATYVYEGNPAWTIAGVAGWYTQADFDMGCNFPMNNVEIEPGDAFTVFAPGDEIGEIVTIPSAL